MKTFPGSTGHRSSTRKDMLYEKPTSTEALTGPGISTSNGVKPNTEMLADVLINWRSGEAPAMRISAISSSPS